MALISVTNFNNGGRLATVHSNLIRNIGVQRPRTSPEDAGIGIGIEAETAVTGNVVESAAHIGIRAGWGPYLRNVTISGNIVRNAAIGIAVSVAPKAGDAKPQPVSTPAGPVARDEFDPEIFNRQKGRP